MHDWSWLCARPRHPQKPCRCETKAAARTPPSFLSPRMRAEQMCHAVARIDFFYAWAKGAEFPTRLPQYELCLFLAYFWSANFQEAIYGGISQRGIGRAE